MSSIGFRDNETRPVERTWQEREIGRNLSWGNGRRSVHVSGISFKNHSHSSCATCHHDIKPQAIRCLSCRHNLCSKCDYLKHITNPFHRRLYVTQNVNDVLLPSVFFDINWKKVEQGKITLLFLHFINTNV